LHRDSDNTLVRDPGLSVRQVEDALQTFGESLDYAKTKQFELFYMDEATTRAKVALYREHAVGTANAQDYPARTIRIIVPLAPGGGNDTMARL